MGEINQMVFHLYTYETSSMRSTISNIFIGKTALTSSLSYDGVIDDVGPPYILNVSVAYNDE